MLNELIVQTDARDRFVARIIPFTSTGIQSRVVFGELDGQTVIKKTAGDNLSLLDQYRLLEVYLPYREQLVNAGFSLPQNHSICLKDGIESIDEFIEGADVDALVKTESDKLEAAWIQMTELICKANNGSNRSKAMIDAKPANFIVDPQGTMYYIDFFPPMIHDQNGLIEPFIPEVYKRDIGLMSFNFGDTRGQITKLLALINMQYPSQAVRLTELTLDRVQTLLPQETANYILQQSTQGLPDMKSFYSGDLSPLQKLA